MTTARTYPSALARAIEILQENPGDYCLRLAPDGIHDGTAFRIWTVAGDNIASVYETAGEADLSPGVVVEVRWNWPTGEETRRIYDRVES